MMKHHFPNLVQFFGGCFNQDWRLDAPTPDAVINRFFSENSEGFVLEVVSELDKFLSSAFTDEDLRSILYEEFHCYYLPSEGAPVRDWLKEVRARLSLNR